jgi:hypothetical protein
MCDRSGSRENRLASTTIANRESLKEGRENWSRAFVEFQRGCARFACTIPL